MEKADLGPRRPGADECLPYYFQYIGLVSDGPIVVSEVEVPHETMGVHRAISFWTVQNQRITHGREYWTQPGSDPSPAWRAPYVQPL